MTNYNVDVACDSRDSMNLLSAEYGISKWVKDSTGINHTFCLIPFTTAEKAFDFIQKVTLKGYENGWKINQVWKS